MPSNNLGSGETVGLGAVELWAEAKTGQCVNLAIEIPFYSKTTSFNLK